MLRILQQVDFGHVGPTLIRKSFLTRVGGFEVKPNLGEDINLMLRLAMAGGEFREARSEKAAFFYRQTPDSLGRAFLKNANAMRNLLHTFRSVEEFLRAQSPDRGLSEDAGRALAMRYSRFARFYYEDDPESFCMLMSWIKGTRGCVPHQPQSHDAGALERNRVRECPPVALGVSELHPSTILPAQAESVDVLRQ